MVRFGRFIIVALQQCRASTKSFLYFMKNVIDLFIQYDGCILRWGLKNSTQFIIEKLGIIKNAG